MILRLFGALIVCACSALIGMYFAYRETFRINDLNEMKRALLILRSEIEFAVNMLPSAFLNISQRTNPPVNEFFKKCGNLLNETEGHSAAYVWNEQTEILLKNGYFADEDIACFVQFGLTLGYLDVGMQLSGIDMTLLYLDGKVSELSKNCLKSQKMYRSLGVIGGILITAALL